MKKTVVALLLLCVALVLAGWLTTPPALKPPVDALVLPSDPQTYLQRREAEIAQRFGIVPGAEKRIRWAGVPGERTPRVVIYLHGFSATRQEIAPVPEHVAKALGANLFATRLAGHGRERVRMEDVPAEQWLVDGVEALAIGRALGERLILIGTSTGATLALALARHPDFAAVEGLVFLSPNFAPAAEGSKALTGPFGPQILRASTGPIHSWDAANELQEKYWTTSYASAALVEMMRLVDLAQLLVPEATVDNALMIYSPDDDVVSVKALRSGFDALPAKRKQIEVISQGNGLSNHVLTGDILAPAATQATVDLLVRFLQPTDHLDQSAAASPDHPGVSER